MNAPIARPDLRFVTRAATFAALTCAITACAVISPTRPRPLGKIIAQSDMTVGTNVPIRVLPDGRVFVSEDYGSQLWLLDPDLKNARLIGDTTAATNHYIPGIGYYVRPYLGDSSLLVRSGVSDGWVIDAQGKKIRVVSPTNGQFGEGPWTIDMMNAPFTSRGDVMVRAMKPRLATASVESVYVVRTSFAEPGRRDTVGMLVRQPRARSAEILAGDGAAMFSDGAIAIVRAKDYHVDWIEPDGRRWSNALPHRWIVLSEKDKRAAIDSSRRVLGARADSMRVEDIPDTVPPITWVGLIAADADDNLWIERVIARTNPYRPPQRGQFDIVNRRGQVVRRLVLPPPAVVKAFAPGRVYFTLRVNGQSRLMVGATR